jgi:hypothetical protein
MPMGEEKFETPAAKAEYIPSAYGMPEGIP